MDGASGRFWLAEEATADPYGMTTKRQGQKARTTADPYGMTNKKAKAKAKADPPPAAKDDN
jgi:hypothetical protein